MIGREFEHLRGFQTALKSLSWRGFLASIALDFVGDDERVKGYGNSFSALEKRGGCGLEMGGNSGAGSAKTLKMSANNDNIIPFLEC